MTQTDVRTLIQSLLDIIEDTLMEDISVEKLIASSYLSRSQCYALFTATTGYSIKEYIRKRRLSHIAYTLIPSHKTALTLSEYAQYGHSESFLRAFKRTFSMTLSEYRQSSNPFELFPPCKLHLYHYKLGGARMQFDQTQLQAHWRQGATILDIDIDRFIAINDTYGKAAGDAVIATLFHRLQNMQDHDGVFRVGGDEFAMIVSKPSVNIEELCSQILSLACEPIIYQDINIYITVSIGIAKGTYEPTLSVAQDAMLEAKKAGRNQVR